MVRKWFGHDHISRRFAPQVNADRLRPAFAQGVLTPYLNHHHPYLFATEVRDCNGKVRRRYRRRDVATPYEKLKSLPDAEWFLKPGVSFAELDKVAYVMSDPDANRRANRGRSIASPTTPSRPPHSPRPEPSTPSTCNTRSTNSGPGPCRRARRPVPSRRTASSTVPWGSV